MWKKRKQLSLNLVLHSGQREESVTEDFRLFNSSEDNWLEFLKGHPVENQKYFLLVMVPGKQWWAVMVFHGKRGLKLDRGQPSVRFLWSQQTYWGTAPVGNWDLLELSSSVPELRLVLTKGFCLPCSVSIGCTQTGTLPLCMGFACGRSMWCWAGPSWGNPSMLRNCPACGLKSGVFGA